MRYREFLIEYNRDVTKQKIGDKLATAGQTDRNVDTDTILATLEEIDPTPNKQYVLWLANQYIKKLFRLEDKNRVKDVLEKFMQVKSRLPEKDIGRYTFHSLEDTVDKIFNVTIKPQQQQAQQTFEVPKNVKVLYNGPLGLLAIPKSHKASCLLGAGTKWCTAAKDDPDTFETYNEWAPLYVWRDKNGEKYQFYFSTEYDIESQFMDNRDRPIKKELINYFRYEHPVLKQLFAKQEKKMIKQIKDEFYYDTSTEEWYKKDSFMPEQVLSYLTATDSRWPMFEKLCYKFPRVAAEYASTLQTRFPEAEPYIMKDPFSAVDYAANVLKGPWKEAEPYILKDLYQTYQYIWNVREKRWPEAEPYLINAAMKKSKDFAIESLEHYFKHYVKKRWPEAEPVFKRNRNLWRSYKENLRNFEEKKKNKKSQ